MNISIFLSKIIGPLFIIIALSLIINASLFKNFIKDIQKNQIQLYFIGLVSFIIGMIVVLKHNIWEWNGFVIITILGYIAIIKGTSLLIFPKTTLKITDKLKISKKLLKIIGFLYLIIGFYITYLGYFS